MGQLSFNMADAYPGMAGYYTTRTATVPEPEDLTALVDDDEAGHEMAVHSGPETHKGIWISVLLVVAVVIFIGR